MKRGPLKVFYSYAHEDEYLRDQIDEHLELLARQNLVVRWYDRHIVPGTEWNTSIGDALSSADIILLLVSRSFMASSYVKEVEIPEAMRVHQSGSARVVPVLLDDIPGWKNAPFAKLDVLPTKAKPVSEWEDTAEAFSDIARGIRKVAKDIIIAGGGPFDFGPREFMEAELAILPKLERERTEIGLKRLRQDLIKSIPSRSYESNLLVATWSLRQFGYPARMSIDHTESLFYIAQTLTSFDLVALQEVDRNLKRLEALLEILGPDWKVLLTDVAPGIKGNRERYAILYYTPRVEFRNFSSQVILPPERKPEGGSLPVQQFARPPLLAAFRSGNLEFQVCTAHIIYGGDNDHAIAERLEEVRKLGKYLKRRSQYEETDLLLMGDFQLINRKSQILDTLRENGVQVPDELLYPTSLINERYYDLIGYASSKLPIPLGSSQPRSGTFNLFDRVLRSEDLAVYAECESFRQFSPGLSGKGEGKTYDRKELERRFRFWKTYAISDHLPLWTELSVDRL